VKHDLAGGFTLPSIPKRTLVAEPIADRFTDAANDEVEGPSSRVMPKSSKLRRAEHGDRDRNRAARALRA
jgi:hypothetical protein